MSATDAPCSPGYELARDIAMLSTIGIIVILEMSALEEMLFPCVPSPMMSVIHGVLAGFKSAGKQRGYPRVFRLKNSGSPVLKIQA